MPVLARLWLPALLALAACAQPPVNRTPGPLPVAESVDLDSYLGRWFEIARYEHNFEKDCVDVTAEYSLREDGLIRVINTCRKATDGRVEVAQARARIVDGSNNAKLKVSFFGPFWGDYWILDVADDYGWALVGEPEGRYLWILARTPSLPEDVLEARIGTLRGLGYNIDALYFTPQSAAE